VVEHENMLDIGDEVIFAETIDNQVPMLASLRDESDTENTEAE
jgi:hypothetical protein